jgi:2-oxo-3-hexenedioate decarboxylase
VDPLTHSPDIAAIARRLIAAQDTVASLPPISAGLPEFDVAHAYAVLAAIEQARRSQGWQPAGRKIGFTNRTIWARYGVHQPMVARVWSHTVHRAPDGRASLSLAPFVRPRIEPEVVFGLARPVPLDGDAEAILDAVAWIAPGFEIVQSHFPDWKFTAADCTAAFGLHAALVVGQVVDVTPANRRAIARLLPTFEVTLSRGDTVVDRGVGVNVLDSPALALSHMARTLAAFPALAPLEAGEIVTTGTVTDAWPVVPGETWRSDYGALALSGLELTFT